MIYNLFLFERNQSGKQDNVSVNIGVIITHGSCFLAQRTGFCRSERITEPSRTQTSNTHVI